MTIARPPVRTKPNSRRLLRTVLAASVGAAILSVVPASTAGAEPVDAYPHAGAVAFNAAAYEWWVDENRNGIADVTSAPFDNDEAVSPRGYYYRNCTDYVAWKLESIGVSSTDARGNGNGGEWDDNNATLVTATPQPGMAAVFDNFAPPWGHVAFVEAVHPDGTVTLSEYNFGTSGSFGVRSGSPSSLGITSFVDFGASYGTQGASTGGDWDGDGADEIGYVGQNAGNPDKLDFYLHGSPNIYDYGWPTGQVIVGNWNGS